MSPRFDHGLLLLLAFGCLFFVNGTTITPDRAAPSSLKSFSRSTSSLTRSITRSRSNCLPIPRQLKGRCHYSTNQRSASLICLDSANSNVVENVETFEQQQVLNSLQRASFVQEFANELPRYLTLYESKASKQMHFQLYSANSRVHVSIKFEPKLTLVTFSYLQTETQVFEDNLKSMFDNPSESLHVPTTVSTLAKQGILTPHTLFDPTDVDWLKAMDIIKKKTQITFEESRPGIPIIIVCTNSYYSTLKASSIFFIELTRVAYMKTPKFAKRVHLFIYPTTSSMFSAKQIGIGFNLTRPSQTVLSLPIKNTRKRVEKEKIHAVYILSEPEVWIHGWLENEQRAKELAFRIRTAAIRHIFPSTLKALIGILLSGFYVMGAVAISFGTLFDLVASFWSRDNDLRRPVQAIRDEYFNRIGSSFNSWTETLKSVFVEPAALDLVIHCENNP